MLISLLFLVSFAAPIFSENDTDRNKFSDQWEQCAENRLIVGGKKITIEDAPFTLFLKIMKGRGYLICGATILSKRAAITARHCVARDTFFGVYPLDPNSIIVKAGTTIANQGKTHFVRKIVLYSTQFQPTTVQDDIALLFFHGPFVFSSSIKPAKLPKSDPKVGFVTDVAGWGVIQSWDGIGAPPQVPSRILKKAEVPIVDVTTCRKIFRVLMSNQPPLDGNKLMCAGRPEMEVDACVGDSGGPLFHKDTLYGVVSAGFGCAWPCRPGLYVNVFHYLQWIKEMMMIEGEKAKE